MRDVLIEGFAPDALGLAAWLAARGDAVRLAGPGTPTPAAERLRAVGVRVEGAVDLDADPGAPEVAYLDVWTPEVAPRVARLRAAGTTVTSLSDLLLERASVPVVGVTGTAGKSTTAAFLAALLRHAGVVVHEATGSRPGQRWATEELIPLLDEPAEGVLLLELTSSHLAFCRHSPDVAVVTCLWPDHVELHGSVSAYVAAKHRIVDGQRPEDAVVVNADDASAAAFADRTPARRWAFSAEAPVAAGAFLREGVVIACAAGRAQAVGDDLGASGGRRQAALGAVAAALALGVEPGALVGGLGTVEQLPHRARLVGRRGGVELVDDAAAATAQKAAATVGSYPPGSVIAVLGGDVASVGLAVQASAEERALVEEALAVIARAAAHAVVFGSAGRALEPSLRAAGVPVHGARTIEDALERALGLIGTRTVKALVVAPMYPVAQRERSRVAARLSAAADAR